MVNRVNAAFDDMKGSENTGGTENSRGLEHMSTVENTGGSLMRNLLPPDICVAETTGDFGHLRDAEREYFASAVPKRVSEATTARSCARLALKRLYLREPESPNRRPSPCSCRAPMVRRLACRGCGEHDPLRRVSCGGGCLGTPLCGRRD